MEAVRRPTQPPWRNERGSLRDGWAVGFILSAVLAGATALAAIIALIVILVSRPIGRTTCANWSTETGYPSKFVILNPFSTGTCLARTPGGRWVKNTQVLTFTNHGKP